jgi:hypothetical protein
MVPGWCWRCVGADIGGGMSWRVRRVQIGVWMHMCMDCGWESGDDGRAQSSAEPRDDPLFDPGGHVSWAASPPLAVACRLPLLCPQWPSSTPCRVKSSAATLFRRHAGEECRYLVMAEVDGAGQLPSQAEGRRALLPVDGGVWCVVRGAWCVVFQCVCASNLQPWYAPRCTGGRTDTAP